MILLKISYASEKKYPESFRLILFYDEEDKREFTFRTNARHISTLDSPIFIKTMAFRTFLQIAETASQNKEVLGTTENAVQIQISMTIITYFLVIIVQHDIH